MFRVVKGWPVGVGGLYEHSIDAPLDLLATIDHDGTVLALENGVWALADAAELAIGNQVATPAANKQNALTICYTVDKNINSDAGTPGYDTGFVKQISVVQGDFLAWIDSDVYTGALAAGNYVTVSATDGKLAAAGAGADTLVVGVVEKAVVGDFGASAWEVRFFTPKYVTLS